MKNTDLDDVSFTFLVINYINIVVTNPEILKKLVCIKNTKFI